MEQKVSRLTKLFYAEDLEKLVTKDTRKHVAFVQSIPQVLTVPELNTYSTLDVDDESQKLGMRKVQSIEIELLFTKEQYDTLKSIQNAKTNGYWAIQLPKEIAIEAGKPLIWYFTGMCHIGVSEIVIDNMLKAKLTIYRNLEIE